MRRAGDRRPGSGVAGRSMVVVNVALRYPVAPAKIEEAVDLRKLSSLLVLLTVAIVVPRQDEIDYVLVVVAAAEAKPIASTTQTGASGKRALLVQSGSAAAIFGSAGSLE